LSEILRSILELDKKVQGPMPSFTAAHLLLTSIIIHDKASIGRKELSKELELGEGATRTIVKKLSDLGIVVTDATGSKLTAKGNRFYNFLRHVFSGPFEIPSTSITVGKFQVAAAFRDCGNKVKDGILQRDKAIIHGAEGATTYIYKNSKFVVPGGSSDCEREYPNEAWSVIREKLLPKENDAIIVCGANSVTRAKLGCIAAGLTLV
jgi:predicted transcriptional regulator